ncbi:hypothetical protein EJB05_40826, partial [Eragrostis curvula]
MGRHLSAEGNKIDSWPRPTNDEVITNGGAARWSHRRVIELDKLLPNHALSDSPRVLTIVNAVGVTFVATPSGHFSIDLKSGRVTDLFEGSDERYIASDPYLINACAFLIKQEALKQSL